MGEYYRSKSYADGRMEIEVYYGENNEKPTNNTSTISSNNNGDNTYNNGGLHEMRCYSASYVTTSQQQQQQIPKELKKGKSVNASSKAGWCFSDPEMARKKRVASYKAYSVEGKIKKSFSKSFRWIKDRYSNMLQGW
ncbi:uncharacterized protein LOC110712944 [Chenopodium quinoa]|uniref:uncharacterized protein LOC110712944 n=1 Tax=Chenopodium quinoa TaxID=63459 RepID=UPI000B78EB50|nr:uncharacterized protein LOC110712944 [Chenopodium quinoa]